jgi:predicted amidohydrolase
MYTEEFCQLAKEYGLYLIMGTIIEREGDNLYNTSLLIDDTGKILGKYRKIKLWAGEKNYIKRGENAEVFETKFGKIGIEICWDLAFPEITKEMMLKGARMIFCTSFWLAGDKYGSITSPEVRGKIPEIDTESIFVDACVPARAIENEVIFIYVNGCGEFSTAKFTDRLIGHTQIAVPFYSTVAKAGDEETLLISEIDLELTELAEKSYEIREDSPKGLAYLFEERSG